MEERPSPPGAIDLIDTGPRLRASLGADLGLSAAGPLRAALLEVLAHGKPIEIDARAVARISTPCVQVLLAAAASARGCGQAFVLTEASDAFIAGFSDLGLFPALMSWHETS
jgi:anti-anti-sigma regulatory factor